MALSNTASPLMLLQMMNWDWQKNRPSVMPNTLEATTEQGW